MLRIVRCVAWLHPVALTLCPLGVQGDKRLFIRNDELEAAWKLFTPLLQHIEKTRMVRCPLPRHHSACPLLRTPARVTEWTTPLVPPATSPDA